MIGSTTTLLDLLDDRSFGTSAAPLITYRESHTQVSLSRAALATKAHAIAAHIRDVAEPGDRVLLVIPSAVEFLCGFFGALCAGVAAVPLYPPDRRPQSVRRFLALIQAAKPTAALTTAPLLSEVTQADLPPFRWIAADEVEKQDADAYSRPDIDGDTIAYIQYTSGSTGTPRGVIHAHRNVLDNMALLRRAFELGPATRYVVWLPLYHDMGLITTLTTLQYGSHVAMMSPAAFLRDPIEWLRTISRERASWSGAPNFAYDLCARRATDADCSTLDLGCWTRAYNGAEPVRPETLERFVGAFARCGFRRDAFLPCYGLAEATLLVSVGPCGAGPVTRDVDDAALSRGLLRPVPPDGRPRRLVASGMTHPEAAVAIVDPETCRRRSADQIGEVWVRGPGVGLGYWQRPDESRATFCARIEPEGDGPFLRTGDLGFLADGQLFVTGRIKDLIVIRGQNLYPHDIEAVVTGAHEAVRRGCCAAFALSGDEGEALGVVFELDRHCGPDARFIEIIAAVRDAISENFSLAPVVVAIVTAGTVPKTSSGKLRRLACRAALLANELPILAVDDVRSRRAPNTTTTDEHGAAARRSAPVSVEAVRARLLRELTRHLQRRVDEEAVVTRLGIDSVTAIEVMFTIEQEFGLTIAPAEMAESITVGELARRIACGEDMGGAAAPSAPATARERAGARPLDLSLMYFSTDTLPTAARYDILLRSARFADEHGFRALWVPERHFHPFGGTYPNPSVAASALAVATRRVRLRAGSVVLPLHNPIRVAEEWSFVDNLSNGRVDLSFATGWNPNDFVLAPDSFADRRARTLDGIRQVQGLWSGEVLVLPNGKGEETRVAIHPRPLQSQLHVWLTCTMSAEGFKEAGALGYNVLTALLFQRVEDLAEKVALYRAARARHGHDPAGGTVTLMLHTFVGASPDTVRRTVAGPFKRYLASSIELWRNEWPELATVSGSAHDQVLNLAFERYAHGNALFGTPASCADLVTHLHGIGVDEIACLIDFGVDTDEVLRALVYLHDLGQRVGCSG